MSSIRLVLSFYLTQLRKWVESWVPREIKTSLGNAADEINSMIKKIQSFEIEQKSYT